ncbi:hypothetical protein FUSPEROL_01457 [Fusobacterium periodonticum ATCC 33693]|uniref:Uncharacterized protein n=1 Tax=Fusobacterium periodonticum ATCC 33693 TaxID=546275 RepID=D4CVL3_9FUSO|nr:hypothetical protein FUSPEROL_01457 [Fusobacterium periodonticum ATCC 33693]
MIISITIFSNSPFLAGLATLYSSNFLSILSANDCLGYFLIP